MSAMTTATLEEMAAQAELAPGEVIPSILEHLSPDDQDVFLSGLSELIVHNTEGVPRWVASWLISAHIANDQHFNAADREASQLVDCGKLGPGLTSRSLRARYNR